MNQIKRIPLHLSLHEAIQHWSKYYPQKPAIIGDKNSISYRELQCGITKCRALVSDLRLGRQSPIGILVADKSKFIAAICATLAEGHAPALVNLSLEPQILKSMILDAGCNALLVDAETENPAKTQLDHIPKVSVPNFGGNDCKINCHPPVEERLVDDVWGIIYSSGTTGTPKGIIRSDLSVLTELVGWCLELPITRDSIAFIGRPVYYTGGLVLTAATLLVGGSVILPNLWSVEGYRSFMATNVVDFAFLIPDQVRELVQHRQKDAIPWASPRRILTMGAPMPEDLKQSVLEVLQCEYIESWGNSEGLGTITSEHDARLRPSSIGRPFLSDDLFAVDDYATLLPTGTIGRIAGRADSVLTRYQNREDLDRALIHDQMVISEDLGYVGNDGYLYLVGRVNQRIVRNGDPIFGTDIENTIIGINNVHEVAVIGVSDPLEGEVPIAVVALKPGASKDPEILSRINSKLLPQQRLANVYFLSDLPRNAAGKVDYRALKEQISLLNQGHCP